MLTHYRLEPRVKTGIKVVLTSMAILLSLSAKAGTLVALGDITTVFYLDEATTVATLVTSSSSATYQN